MIAEVALNLPLRRVFDYLPREDDRELIVPGCRVIVPFGSRLMSGVVVGLKTASDVPAHRLRSMERLAGGDVVFSKELLAFTKWVAGYYFCGWGEVLDAALPSGLSVKIGARYRVKEPPLPAKKLKGITEELHPFLLAQAEWDDIQWKRSGATEADFRWLTLQCRPGGAVALRFEYLGTRRTPKQEKWLRLLKEPPPPARGRRNPRKETKKELILRLLREEGELPMASLKARMKAPGEVVKLLCGQGLTQIFEKRAAGGFYDIPPQEPFLGLNPDQERAFEAITEGMTNGKYRGFLLEGVTGSGKTEVYLHGVREALKLGRTSLILVPEIALTENIVRRFRARFGSQVAVLHSGMSEGVRFDEWRRVYEGDAPIVVGARSAVFAPLRNLGLVVVDEEHDSSYKQDETPRYNGRDAAMLRAHQNGAVVVLGSATPSIESFHNVNQGKLEKLALPSRIMNRPLPIVEMLDLRKQPRQKGSPLFTLQLLEATREVLARKEQVMMFLNRRGFAHIVRCSACDQPVVCTQCSITLTYHQTGEKLSCHRCDYSRPLPRLCPTCGEPGIEVTGLGTEKLEQELAIIFPEARILRMDGDSLRRKGELERMLDGIRRRDFDIIIGTQILSKGHDFPYITLVGAVLADVSLNLPDFRSAERTFQILTQMAGRAGRGELPGRVFIQTYNPDHYSLALVRRHETGKFAEREIKIRIAAQMPPSRSQALVWVNGPRPERTEALARNLAGRLRAANGGKVEVLGAVAGAIKRINNRYRWMILLRAVNIGPIHRLLKRVLDDPGFKPGSKERVTVDIDPYNMM